MSAPYIIIRPVEASPYIDRGLFNGYVAVPKGHPWFGVDYDSIWADVHGGLTYGEMEGDLYVVGFDTAHCDDTAADWPIQRVAAECLSLLSQAQEASVTKFNTQCRWCGLVQFNEDEECGTCTCGGALNLITPQDHAFYLGELKAPF